MCGIAGILDLDSRPAPTEPLAAMQAAMRHRGPDDAGVFVDGPLGFAFQRLSILDLERGHQPMSTPDGRFTIVFNGEIYNHLELRKALEAEGARFQTRSDTETLLIGFSRRGPDVFRLLNGMFACAIWDRHARELTLARDPLGIKPLYLCRREGRLWFASELRTLLAGGVDRGLDPAGVMDYLAFGYVHGPSTVIVGIEKFPAAHWMRVTAAAPSKPVRFWSLPPEEAPRVPDPRETQERLTALLEASVRDQMLSDVPVGVFLSGGIDSSVVTAMMVRASSTPIESYSVGFEGGDSVDETRYAETVARHLGTRHETLRLGPGLLDTMPDMARCLDEPIADAAILPTWHLSVQARTRVKVVLTGEGGDELFGGYGRHKAAYVTEAVQKLPAWLRPAVVPMARRMGSGPYFAGLPLDGPASWAQAESDQRLRPTVETLTSTNPFAPWLASYAGLTGLNGLLAFDLQTSMVDQLLMKVDKTTMRASLEARVPLLDLRLVDFMFRLPPSLKIRLFRGKYLLRRVAAQLLPREIVVRRKHGFILRVGKWMRSPSNRLCAEVLGDGVLPDTGLFRREALARGVKDLRDGSDSADPIFYFRLLVLGLWLEDACAPASVTASAGSVRP